MKVSEDKWYDEASLSSSRWWSTCKEGLKSLIANDNLEAQEYAVDQIISQIFQKLGEVTGSDTKLKVGICMCVCVCVDVCACVLKG